jgi:diguanylate cyclase (GGDEF)-like protein
MSVDLFRPTSAIARISKRLSQSRLASHLRVGLLAAAAGAAAVFVLEPLQGTPRLAFAHLVLLVAPAVAAASCIIAIQTLPGGRRAWWGWFAAAGASASLGQLVSATEQLALSEPPSFAAAGPFIALLVYPFFVTGAVLALRANRARRAVTEALLDGILLGAIGTVALIRLGLEPLYARPELASADFLALLGGLLGSIGALYVAGLLLVGHAPAIPARTAIALFGAAAALALGNVLQATVPTPAAARPGGPFDVPWLAAWALVTWAAVESARTAGRTHPEHASSRLLRRVPHVAVPAAALFLGFLGMESALRTTVSAERGVALATLGALLATRIALALRFVERQTEEQRRLSHTRALVEVSHALACSTELDRTLQLVAHWAARLLRARGAGIELLSEHGDTLELRAAYGLPPHVLGIVFPLEGSFTGWVVRHGRPRATVDPSKEPLIQPESRDFLGTSPVAAAPLLYRGRPLGALFACARDMPFDQSDLELLRALADQAAIAIENARLFEQVRALSLTDPLTGLANRRQLERELAREFAAARRGRKLVVVVFDLDDFKVYNDRYGHLAGDEVLRIFGEVLGQETRAMNLAARYGGDEFVAVLSDSDRERALVFIERVRQRFHERAARLGREPITASAGLAVYHPSMARPEDLIAAADEVLYQSKASRDRSRT